MTSCPVSTVVASKGASNFALGYVLASNMREECIAKLTDWQDPVDLIVSSTTGEISVTLLAGNGPSAAGDRSFTVPSGQSKCISVSSGEFLHADGCIHFVLEGGLVFSTLRPRVGVVQHINVLTH